MLASADGTAQVEEMSFGPPRYFVPVCVLTQHGFIGGPSGYKEVSANRVPEGPIIIEHEVDGRGEY
jgi:hypothetical protein